MLERSRHRGGRSTASIHRSPAERPYVLYLSCHLPWPAISGGRRRELELIKRIAERFDVHLLVVSKTAAEDVANAHVLRPYCRAVEVFPATPPGPEAFEFGQPTQVVRHRCPRAAARVAEIIDTEPIDLIHVEGFYLMQHVPGWTAVPVVLVEQNIEYELERQRTARTGASDGRPSIETEAAERRCWRRATCLAAVTREDRDTIETALGTSVRIVPDGADHVHNLTLLNPDGRVRHPGAPLLVFLANFAYAPNVDAARYLVGEILPVIRQRIPGARLWLVGNAPPREVREMRCAHVEVTGYVPDVLPYLDVADVVVCPLRIGGGIKVKAIEALRRGKAIVSTAIGAQGLPARARAALAIADDPAEFAGAAATLLTHPVLRAKYERHAARAACELPSWDEAGEALGLLYDDVLDRAPARAQAVRRQAAAGACV